MSRLAIALPFAAALLAGAPAAGAPPKPLQTACQKALAYGLGCRTTPKGVVIAADDANARRLAPYAARAEERFKRYFKVAPPAYSFAYGSADRLFAVTKAIGLPAYVIYPSADQKAEQINGTIRRSVEAALAGADPKVREAQVVAAIAASGTTVDAERASDHFAIPHELGHAWFSETYWPEYTVVDESYQSPAPDWLDEGVSQLMEAEGRRAFDRSKKLRDLKDDPAVKSGFLRTILSQEHPMVVFSKFRRGKPKLSTIGQKELAEAGVQMNSVAIFYARSAALADFLIEGSGKETILIDIAKAYRSGRSFETGTPRMAVSCVWAPTWRNSTACSSPG